MNQERYFPDGKEREPGTYKVVDFFGLNRRQIGNVSPIIGGSGKYIVKARTVVETMSPNDNDVLRDFLTQEQPDFVVVRWGQEQMEDILAALNPEARISAVIGERLWTFRMLSRNYSRYDEAIDEFVPDVFDPREYFTTDVVLLPWDHDRADATLSVMNEQEVRPVIMSDQIGDFYLQFEFGMDMNTEDPLPSIH